MTLIPLSAKQSRFSLAGRVETARAAAASAAGVMSRLFRAGPASWTRLSARLLADIGETPTSAEAEALREPFHLPLGSLGAWPNTCARRHAARAASPLG